MNTMAMTKDDAAAITVDLQPAMEHGILQGGYVSPKVVRALLGIMYRCKDIPKTGWNPEGKYAFVSKADADAKIHDAMVAEQCLITQVEIDKKIINKILFATYTYHAMHADGDCILNIMRNTGSCRFEFKSGTADDKSMQKAHSYAKKTAYLQVFQIPTDDATVERADDAPETEAGGLNDNSPPVRGDDRQEHNSRNASREELRGRDDTRRDDVPRNDVRRAEGAARDTQAPADNRWDEGERREAPGERVETAPSHKQRVNRMMALINEAMDREEAEGVWRGSRQLINDMGDTTFDWCREAYNQRWSAYPPGFEQPADAE